jgi:hypothetical protein
MATKLLFVTGSNAGFFNTLLICPRSFAERLPAQRLLVCDYGLTAPQAEFPRELGMLIERPPGIEPRTNVFICKAAPRRYLRHGGHRIEGYDAVVWLDGDLTLIDVGIADFEAVAHTMRRTGAMVAICPEATGKSIGQMIEYFDDTSIIEPFVRLTADHAIDPSRPYFSTGLFFCRSATVLEQWDQLTLSVPPHPVFEQNMFNIVLQRDLVPVVALDCDEWQAQGYSLDRVQLVTDADGLTKATIGTKSIKTLHSTSPLGDHLLMVNARMTVHHFELRGIFKLLFAEPLRMVQIQLLARFIHAHGISLVHLGLCRNASQPIDGFQFLVRNQPRSGSV